MRNWIETDRIDILAIVSAVATSAGELVSGGMIAVPAFGGNEPFAPVPIVSLLGMAIPLTYAGLFHAASLPQTLVAVVPLRVINVLAAGATLVLSTLVAALLGTFIWEDWLLYVRTVGPLTALVVVAVPFVGYRSAALAPALFVFLASIFGHESSGAVAVWAWVIDPQLQSWHLALSLIVTGLGMLLAGAIRPRSRTLVIR